MIHNTNNYILTSFSLQILKNISSKRRVEYLIEDEHLKKIALPCIKERNDVNLFNFG